MNLRTIFIIFAASFAHFVSANNVVEKACGTQFIQDKAIAKQIKPQILKTLNVEFYVPIPLNKYNQKVAGGPAFLKKVIKASKDAELTGENVSRLHADLKKIMKTLKTEKEYSPMFDYSTRSNAIVICAKAVKLDIRLENSERHFTTHTCVELDTKNKQSNPVYKLILNEYYYYDYSLINQRKPRHSIIATFEGKIPSDRKSISLIEKGLTTHFKNSLKKACSDVAEEVEEKEEIKKTFNYIIGYLNENGEDCEFNQINEKNYQEQEEDISY